MKLYNSNLSPYCSRVRYVIYSRHIPCEIQNNLADEGFTRASPLKKVPALEDNGIRVFESEVINEYFADIHKPPIFVALLPTDPAECAKSRIISRIVDLYISPNMFVLWTKVEASVLEKGLAEMNKALDAIEEELVGPLSTTQRKAVLGDAALGSMLIHIELFGGRTGFKPQETRPKIKAFWEAMLKDVDFQKVRQEVQAAAKPKNKL